MAILGSWATLPDQAPGNGVAYRWTGDGDLGTAFHTPKLSLGYERVTLWLEIYGTGTATNGASPGVFDAYGSKHPDHYPPNYVNGDTETLPRMSMAFYGGNTSAANLPDPTATLDASADWANGYFVAMRGTGNTFYAPVCLDAIYFTYTPNDTTGGQLEHLDLIAVKA